MHTEKKKKKMLSHHSDQGGGSVKMLDRNGLGVRDAWRGRTKPVCHRRVVEAGGVRPPPESPPAPPPAHRPSTLPAHQRRDGNEDTSAVRGNGKENED
jgi:hypothetical protein